MRKLAVVAGVLCATYLLIVAVFMLAQFNSANKSANAVMDKFYTSVSGVVAKQQRAHEAERYHIDIEFLSRGTPLVSYDIITVDIYNTRCKIDNLCERNARELIEAIRNSYAIPSAVGEIHIRQYERHGGRFWGRDQLVNSASYP